MEPPFRPEAAGRIRGADGAVAGALGVTALDAVDMAPEPTMLTAATRKLYAVPLLRPVTTVERTLPTVTVRRTVVPASTCTEYPVGAVPPLLAGADQDTVALALPPTTLTPVTVPGAVAGI